MIGTFERRLKEKKKKASVKSGRRIKWSTVLKVGERSPQLKPGSKCVTLDSQCLSPVVAHSLVIFVAVVHVIE
jgi:hypothetical protein